MYLPLTVFYFTNYLQVRKFKEKQEREKFKKEKERKKAASEILERHRGNKDAMKAIRRNRNNHKSADKSLEVLEREEIRERERERDRKGFRDQARDKRHISVM